MTAVPRPEPVARVLAGTVKVSTDGSGTYATTVEASCGHVGVEVQRFDPYDADAPEWVLYGVRLGLFGDALEISGTSLEEFVSQIRDVAAALIAAADLLDGATDDR